MHPRKTASPFFADDRKDTFDLSRNDFEQGDLSPSKFHRELNLPRSRIHQRNRTRVGWHASIQVRNYAMAALIREVERGPGIRCSQYTIR